MQGLYPVMRLQQCMKNSSAIFEERTEETLKKMTGGIIFQDDVLVLVSNDSQCRLRFQSLRDRLKDINFIVNEIKSRTIAKQISFPGNTSSAMGIHPYDQNVKKY